MSPRIRIAVLVLICVGASLAGMPDPVRAGSLSTWPSQPSSRDTFRVDFYEPDWHDSCPPGLQEVVVDGSDITIRVGLEPDSGCILVFLQNPYTVRVGVGPLPVGTYNLTVEAPDYTTREPELTTTTVEVVEPVQCGLVHQPAATVLLPYFEVDMEDSGGRTTLFSVGSVDVKPVLAHAVVWTNRGNPAISFDFFVPAEGLLSFNVRDLVLGRLPETLPPAEPPDGRYGSCTAPLTLPEIDEEALLALVTGQPHPEDGLCYASSVEDGRLATGYITVDVVRDCSGAELRTPLEVDTDYFVDGGTGLATNDNVLWGDFFLIDPSNDFAQGEMLVTVIADAERFGAAAICDPEPCLPRIFPTFYRRGDNRRPLAKVMRSRFLNGGLFTGDTELVLWIVGQQAPRECEDDGSLFGEDYQVDAETRNEAGESQASHRFGVDQLALRLAVGSDQIPPGVNFGSIDVSAQLFFNLPTIPPAPEDLQVWMMPLISADGRFSVGMGALPIEDFCR